MIIGITISVAAVIIAICTIVGIFKGYSATSTWAVDYLLTSVITLLVYSFVDFENDVVKIGFTYGTAILLLLLFTLISVLVKHIIKRKLADARLLSYYMTYGDREQNVLEIRDALERGDKALYKKLTKRKMKESRGSAGVVDRLFGAITMFIKGVVVCAMIVIFALVALHFTQLSIVTSGGALYSIYTSAAWEFISRYAFDLIIIAILMFAIRVGYRAGVLNTLWIVCIIALIAGAGYSSYWLAFKNDAFISFAAGFAEGGSFLNSQTIAQVAIMVVIFVVEFIILVVLCVVISRAIAGMRETAAVSVIDGVVGAVISIAITFAILLFLGMLLYSFKDFEFMELFNTYCSTAEGESIISSPMASCLYSRNPLNAITVFAEFQSKVAAYFGG